MAEYSVIRHGERGTWSAKLANRNTRACGEQEKGVKEIVQGENNQDEKKKKRIEKTEKGSMEFQEFLYWKLV